MLALVQEAEEAPFEQIAECDRQQQSEGKRGEEAAPDGRAYKRRQRIRHVRANHVEAAVRKIDHTHDAENEGQSARDEEQQPPVLHCVQALDQESGKVHMKYKTAVRSFPRTAVSWTLRNYILQPVAGSASALTATF